MICWRCELETRRDEKEFRAKTSRSADSDSLLPREKYHGLQLHQIGAGH